VADPFPEPRRPKQRHGVQATREPPRTRAEARRAAGGRPPVGVQRAPAPHPDARRRRVPANRRRRLRAVLPLCALLLALWSASCLVDVDLAPVALLAAATPAVALFAVPVLALSMHRHRYAVAAVTLIAAVLPWGMVAGYAVSGPGPAPARGAPRIQVMTLNAQLGHADAGQVVAAVRDQAVNLLVVTELTSGLAHELTISGLGRYLDPVWVEVPAAPAGGIGVWSTRTGTPPATSVVGGTRWPAGTSWLTLGGTQVWVTSVHVSAPMLVGSSRWRDDLAALAGSVRGRQGPRLVVGDLTATPWNAPFRQLTATGVQDAANVAGGGLRATWPAWSPVPVTALDHVLVGGGISVRSVSTRRIAGTDHLALTANLALPPGRTQ
jgi:endonuclease/exonuclease/phosphatase (EEP) superfamily protein YafD